MVSVVSVRCMLVGVVFYAIVLLAYSLTMVVCMCYIFFFNVCCLCCWNLC